MLPGPQGTEALLAPEESSAHGESRGARAGPAGPLAAAHPHAGVPGSRRRRARRREWHRAASFQLSEGQPGLYAFVLLAIKE